MQQINTHGVLPKYESDLAHVGKNSFIILIPLEIINIAKKGTV